PNKQCWDGRAASSREFPPLPAFGIRVDVLGFFCLAHSATDRRLFLQAGTLVATVDWLASGALVARSESSARKSASRFRIGPRNIIQRAKSDLVNRIRWEDRC